MKFRSRLIEIEATQWQKPGDHPKVLANPFNAVHGAQWTVYGAQGWSRVAPGDWIIQEPIGNGFYPCKADVFEKRYEAVP